jgi:hypothetical protein
MTDKRIKNEQWSVKELISKINNQEIKKPRFQRKRKWDIRPKNDNTPNEKDYIEFLFNTENSVHAITFGHETISQNVRFSNIDGNNRINAIKHFIDRPFEIFPHYLDDLIYLINSLDLNEDDKCKLTTVFTNISYNEIVNFKYNVYFNKNGHEILYTEIKKYRDEFENVLEEKIQPKLKINTTEQFDLNVKINVNIFEGYNIDELCITFEDINKYNSNLTQTELLASRLFNENNFDITDNIFKTELEDCIKEYYNNKSSGEVLDCYKFDPSKDKINAYDFIIGFQNLSNKKYNFIDKNDVDGLSLYFKLYKALYGSYNNTFTSENINDFKEKILDSCDILNQIILSIFTDKINGKLFNNTCQDKLQTLKKNNIFMILSSIIGYKNKKIDNSIVKKSLEQCLLYHFMVSDLKNKDKKENFKNYDSITYRAGGKFIESITKNLLTTPEIISNKLTENLFNNLLSELYFEINNPYERKLENGKNKNDKRRNLKFFEKTIMFYYYKERIPINMLENEFSIEHICPNSSEWDGELDKDRTGNLIPLISTINSSRSNRHISEYYKTNNGETFCNFIKDIIPSVNEYDKIVSHHIKKPIIINIELYNRMCEENEEKYKQNFIHCLFNSIK